MCCIFNEIPDGNLRHIILLNCVVYRLCQRSAVYFCLQKNEHSSVVLTLFMPDLVSV